jgi:hypothetical protein
MKVKKLILLAIILFLFAGYFVSRPAVSWMQDYLSKSERVDANVLVIEGWLSANDLKSAIDEYRNGHYDYIFTTGLKSSPAYYNVYSHGYLIFYPGLKIAEEKRSDHIICVKAYSELDGENAAHFFLWVNDSIISDFTAGKSKKEYITHWYGSLSEIDSVMIQFDNDMVGEFGDRNLYVREITFDQKYDVPFLDHSVYDLLNLGGNDRIVNNMNSNAGLTRKRLTAMGVDSSVVIALPGNKVRINRTLTSARALHEWLQSSGIHVKGMNIISSGPHSRRTWMTFSKVFDHSFRIGIIALPDRRNPQDEIHVIKTIRETIAFVYYWFMLLLI